MLKLLNYLFSTGITTISTPCPEPEGDWRGMPALTNNACNKGCTSCVEVCPTDAISIFETGDKTDLALDLGSCIQCGLCIEKCPSETIVENKTFKVSTTSREDLVLTTGAAREEVVAAVLAKLPAERKVKTDKDNGELVNSKNFVSESMHVRVVSTGCSACDVEISAANGPVYDLERFGVRLVASPRFADALFVTGPVGKAMQHPLQRCYGAMAEPRIVIAVGSCAISGGMHKGGYADANGVESVLPVDVFIPGCPPHPWSIVHGVAVAMGKMEAAKPQILSGSK